MREIDSFIRMIQEIEKEMFTEAPVRHEPKVNSKIVVRINGDALPGRTELYAGKRAESPRLSDMIRKVIIAEPKMIVLWKDGTKTIVTAEGEKFDAEKGLLMAFYKKHFGRTYMNDLTRIIETADVVEKKKK